MGKRPKTKAEVTPEIVEEKPAEEIQPEEIQVEETQPEEVKPEVVDEEPVVYDNTGKLFLRYFFSNESVSSKVITKLNKKVYFPKNPNISPGWYVTSVIEEKDKYGVMDAIPITEVPDELWGKKIIKGIFIKPNYEKGVMEIHRAMPKDKLKTEESPIIHTVPLNMPNYTSGNTIENIIQSKKDNKR